jgi:hypothetical protein
VGIWIRIRGDQKRKGKERKTNAVPFWERKRKQDRKKNMTRFNIQNETVAATGLVDTVDE